MSYYTTITILIWLALAILCILVRENARLRAEKKTVYYLSYILLGVAALAEWLGLRLNGADLPEWLLRLIKCVDYTLTPLSGGFIVAQLRSGDAKWRRLLVYVLAANTVFQIAALFTGWMVTVGPDRRYSHGPLYWVYILVYHSPAYTRNTGYSRSEHRRIRNGYRS